ncbi:MAG: SGNH/GDSL hydrolase family protein [Verrucomicrobiota bacterium]
MSLLIFAVGMEAGSQILYRIYKGKWYFKERAASGRGMVQPHPYFGACLVPNVSDERNGVRISHNSFRCRGPEFARPKPPGITRIVTLGGSTTYGVGVSDHETWQHYLGKELGAKFEVINLGAPGGTSLETSLQTALLFSDVQPDVALYLLGWNDARVQHIKDLAPDWSDYHGKWVVSLGLGGRDLAQPTATGYLLKRAVFHHFFPQMDTDRIPVEGTADKLTDRIDARALGHYERNLRNIVALCEKQGVKVVFIPQIMNYRVLTSNQPYGFLPFVRDKDLPKVIGVYNETLARVAKEEKVRFAAEVLEPSYGEADFIDNGHFSASGNQQFAKALAKHLAGSGR